MNEGLLTAMETYGLVGADGDGSEADINTDIEEMLQVLSWCGFCRVQNMSISGLGPASTSSSSFGLPA